MPEFFTINQERLDDLKTALAFLDAQFHELQEAIDFLVESDAPPFEVAWYDEQRRDVLRQCTIMVFLAELNLACYPLSASAVLFIE